MGKVKANEAKKVVGGDGLVDGEVTHGEDIKGMSTLGSVNEESVSQPVAPAAAPEPSVPNAPENEQDQVAEGREEPGEESAPEEEAPAEFPSAEA